MRAIWAVALLVIAAGCHRNAPINTRAEQPTNGLQTIHLFPTATEVRLFVDTGQTDSKQRMVLSPGKGLILSKSQCRELENSLAWNEKYGKEDVASCFIPHHFFQYFDAKHERLGAISVCLYCGGVEVIKGGTLIYDEGRLNIDLTRIKALIGSMGEPTDIECNFHGDRSGAA